MNILQSIGLSRISTGTHLKNSWLVTNGHFSRAKTQTSFRDSSFPSYLRTTEWPPRPNCTKPGREPCHLCLPHIELSFKYYISDGWTPPTGAPGSEGALLTDPCSHFSGIGKGTSSQTCLSCWHVGIPHNPSCLGGSIKNASRVVFAT